MAMVIEQEIDLHDIHLPPWYRKPNPEKVNGLAMSIEEIGLLHPIVVTEDHTLVCGGHRLSAHKQLRRETIRCVVKKMTPDEAEMAWIDENAFRSELTELERGRLMVRRKELYEAIHGKSRPGVPSFVDATVAATGQSRSTVYRDLQVGSIDPVALETLAETPAANNRSQLTEIAKLPKQEQRAVATAVAAGTKAPAKAAKKKAVKGKSNLTATQNASRAIGMLYRILDDLALSQREIVLTKGVEMTISEMLDLIQEELDHASAAAA